VRVVMSEVSAVMDKLMGGKWAEIYREHGIAND
jgi:hypothetical protein